MNENIKIDFAKVRFHIKEFQKVYILEDCSLAFYLPKEKHLETRDKANGKEFKSEDGKEIHKEQEIVKMNSQEEKGEKEEIISKEAAKAYAKEIDKEINALTENTYKEKINTQSQEKRKGKFEDYDVFYDVYTKKENIEKYIEKFEVKNGVVEVEADFFQKCFQKEIYHLIPRLISEQKDKDLHFDPVPLEDKGFVVTDFRTGSEETTKNIDLTFQRRIAEIENPDLTLQTPKEFHRMLNENRDFTQEDKLAQAQAIQKACELRVSEMEKIILEQDKSLKDIINNKAELEEKIKKLQNTPNRTTKETSLLGRLEFLKNNKNKVEDYQEIIKKLENPQAADNQQSNAGDSNIENTDKKKPKTINAKDIGNTGECVASLLFEKKSTRHLSNRRKLDANFNTNGFNHTIPDFLVTLNDYPALVEVKNVQTQSLTEQISFELKLAREYELDYLFLCNHYTKLMDNITGLAEFNSGNKDHTGSRKGFIYHKHAHRSIKTIFKEIYLHHIRGAAPNKIIIKRLNLNDSGKLEEELNKNQSLQNA